MSLVPSSLAASTHLPLEVWRAIAMHFRLGPMRLGDYKPDPEFLERRKCLYRLCLTSQALLAAARPFLYETVVLYVETAPGTQGIAPGAESLAQLLRTLAAQPALRPHVKHLACAMPIGPRALQFDPHDRNASLEAVVYSWLSTCHDFQDLSAADARLFRAVCLLPVPEPLLRLAGRAFPLAGPAAGWWLEYETTAQQLFTALICMTPNLTSLLLEGSRCRRMEECLARLRRNLGCDVLARLETLRIQAGEGRTYFLSFHTMDDVVQGFLQALPSVRRLDLWRAWLPSRHPADQPRYGWLKQLDELHLHMYPEPTPVCEMIRHVSPLKSLALDFLDHISAVPVASPLPSAGTTGDALFLHKTSLTQLRITGNMAYASACGSSIHLWCLDQLTRLRYLVVDLSILCGLPPVGSSVDGFTGHSLDHTYASLFDSLPRSLESLLLVFDGEWPMYLREFLAKAPDFLKTPWKYPNLTRFRHLHLSLRSSEGDYVGCTDGGAPPWCLYPAMLGNFKYAIADSIVFTWDLGHKSEYKKSSQARPKLTPWSLDEFEPPITFAKERAAGAAGQLQRRAIFDSPLFIE